MCGALRRYGIKTIQGTLEIECNTLGIDQVTAVFDGKRVLAHTRELQEVQNAFAVYDAMSEWIVHSRDHLLSAHQLMMAGLVDEPGRFRSGNVGVHGAGRVLMCPPAESVPQICNQAGKSTEFVVFVLRMIEAVLADHAKTEHDAEHVTEQVDCLSLRSLELLAGLILLGNNSTITDSK